MKVVSNTLIAALVKSKQPQYKLAADASLPPWRLSKLLRDEVPIEPEDHRALVAIGKALGLKVADIFTR